MQSIDSSLNNSDDDARRYNRQGACADCLCTPGLLTILAKCIANNDTNTIR